MGFQILNNQHSIEPIDSQSSTSSSQEPSAQTNKKQNSFEFNVLFSGYVDMFSDLETVAEYLAAHEGWFCRCAQPMAVQPFCQDGYLLNVGKFNSLGYEVEPKIAVVLEPPQNNLYVMRTVPIPDYEFPGYEVQYQSSMELNEIEVDTIKMSLRDKIFANKQSIPKSITRLNWNLDLVVSVEFPSFVTRFPRNLIQKSGDHLLSQIVRQVSPRLSYKVQQDFHLSRSLAIPYKNCRGLTQLDNQSGSDLLSKKQNNYDFEHRALASTLVN